MSWHCLQERGEDFSLATYLGGIRSERLKSKSTPAKCCSKDSEMGCSTTSPSGTMCEHSTASPGEDSSMLFRGDFHVKTSAWQEPEWALPVPVRDCGLSICESLKKYGLNMSLPKTHRTCVRMDSAPSSQDLPAWGMTYDGVCWELGMSVQIINETECGYWLGTPTATMSNRSEEFAKGRQPTPAEFVKAWPTPTAQDAKNNGGPSQADRNTQPLNALVGGKLNPRWVEWLMGFPDGWVSLQPLAMPRFQSWRRQHGTF